MSSFGFEAAGTVDQVRGQLATQLQATRRYGGEPDSQADAVLALVRAELDAMPDSPPTHERGAHVTASGNADGNGRYLTVTVRTLTLPRTDSAG